MDVFLDPSVNFHTRRVDSHFSHEGKTITLTMEVSKFESYGNGVYLPQEVVSKFPGNPQMETRNVVLRATV
jgi:hypothetical protein